MRQVDPSIRYGGPEVELLLADLSTADILRLSYAFSCFARFWDEDYRALAARIKQRGGAADEGCQCSSFLDLLQRTAWVPASDNGLHVPCEVFSGAARVARAIFPDWALFVVPAAEAEVDEVHCGGFYEDIGICAELTPQLAIRLLNERCMKTRGIKISALKKIYAYMNERWSEIECREDLVLPMIFVPDRIGSSDFDISKIIKARGGSSSFKLLEEVDLEGEWLAPEMCVWQDPSWLVDSLRVVVGGLQITHIMNTIATKAIRALKDYYDDTLNSFFKQKLKVADIPTSQCYIDIMLQAAREYSRCGPHAVACILRVMNHFSYNLRNLNAENPSDYEECPEYIALRRSASKIHVPSALYPELVCLRDVCWSAYSATSSTFKKCGFGETVLRKCVPRDFPIDCPYGVHDSEGARSASKARDDGVLVHELNVMQSRFYDKVWCVNELSESNLHQRIVVLPPAGAAGDSDWPPASPLAQVTVCHVLSRALQCWSRDNVPDSAARDVIRASIVALSLVIAADQVRVRRRWVFVSPVDGSETDGSDAAETRLVSCILDRDAPGGPRLFAKEGVLTLEEEPRALASCFAELVVGTVRDRHAQVLSCVPSYFTPVAKPRVQSQLLNRL